MKKALLLDAVGHEKVDVLPLIQQQHGSKVTNAFVREFLRGNQFEALQLQEGAEKPEGVTLPNASNIFVTLTMATVLPHPGD